MANIIADALRAVYDYPGTVAGSLAPHAAKFGLRRGDGLALLGWLLDLVGDPESLQWMNEARAYADRDETGTVAPGARPRWSVEHPYRERGVELRQPSRISSRPLTHNLKVLSSSSRWTLAQLQRQMAYHRLLERLYLLDEAWIVKGATALLARDLGVRATIDVDIFRDVARGHRRTGASRSGGP